MKDEISNQDIKALVRRVDKEDPDPEDIKEMSDLLDNNPDIWRRGGDLAVQNQKKLIEDTKMAQTASMAIKAAIRGMRKGLGYKDAPMLEQMLIENVLLSWLRLYFWEYQFTELDLGEGMTLKKAAFWDKRISAAQRRYLRAIETLARVRKITRQTLQINIAETGSQQLNVAGDLNR